MKSMVAGEGFEPSTFGYERNDRETHNIIDYLYLQQYQLLSSIQLW